MYPFYKKVTGTKVAQILIGNTKVFFILKSHQNLKCYRIVFRGISVTFQRFYAIQYVCRNYWSKEKPPWIRFPAMTSLCKFHV